MANVGNVRRVVERVHNLVCFPKTTPTKEKARAIDEVNTLIRRLNDQICKDFGRTPPSATLRGVSDYQSLSATARLLLAEAERKLDTLARTI